MKSWYLLHTKSRQEQLAQENLNRQGYTTYLPLAEVQRRRAGRTHRVVGAMFPSYLFIYLSDKTDDWRPIRSTIGVASLVRFGQIPARIPESLVAELKESENNLGYHEICSKSYDAGDRIRIADGPMEGYEGLYHCTTGKQRVILLLQIAEKQIKVELHSNQIEPV